MSHSEGVPYIGSLDHTGVLPHETGQFNEEIVNRNIKAIIKEIHTPHDAKQGSVLLCENHPLKIQPCAFDPDIADELARLETSNVQVAPENLATASEAVPGRLYGRLGVQP